jgi:flagellar export protein FliJ
MAFRFSLATVLRFRQSIEKREEFALQKLLLEMARIRREIEQLTRQIAGAQAARIKAIEQPFMAAELQTMLHDIDALNGRKSALAESLAALDKERAIQTGKYQAAHRDRQVLSEMSARRKDAYEQQRVLAQQKMLDDLFAARAQRR